MTPALRPMNLGEILDRAFQIYRSRFFAFVGIGLIPIFAAESVQLADRTWLHVNSLVHPVGRPELFLWNTVIWLAYYHVFAVFSSLIEPSSINVASSFILGEKCSLISSLRFVAVRWRSYLWIALLKISAVLLLPELVIIVLGTAVFIFADLTGLMKRDQMSIIPILILIVFVVSLALFIWIGACLSLSVPAAALENIAGFRSLRRSWSLGKGTRVRIWFVWLILFLGSWALAWALEYLLGKSMLLAGSLLHLAPLMRSLYAPAVFVLVTAIYVVLGPILPIALTLFYYDQRIRKEGFDIERMIEAAGLDERPALPAGGQ